MGCGEVTGDIVVSIVHASNLDLTVDCLSSLERTAADGVSMQIVVLDNASGDDLASVIRERFPGVRLIAQSHRAGFGTNHNTVIRATKSTYVFVLNNDTVVPRGSVQGLARYLDAHPQAAVAGPLVRGFDGRQQGSAWRLMSIPVQLGWALTLGQRVAIVSRGRMPKRVGAVSACAMMVRRDAFERIGLFDEAYFMFGEEAEIARRFNALGLESHYVPTVEVYHLGQQSTSRTLERQVNEFWRAQNRYLLRYHSHRAAQLIRWLTGAGYVLAIGAAVVARRLPAKLRPSVSGSRAAWNIRYLKLHVRSAFRGNSGPGLKELAEEWNQAHGVG